MKSNEIEIVPHDSAHYRLFLVKMLYRTPHLHKDFEISTVLEGDISVTVQGETRLLHAGDLFVTNPYESHELQTDTPSLVLSLQISPDFFVSSVPRIEQLIFSKNWLISAGSNGNDSEPLLAVRFQEALSKIAAVRFAGEDFWVLKCTTGINMLFLDLLYALGFSYLSKQEQHDSFVRGQRMRRLSKTIEQHYNEKLLLSDIAEQEHLSLHYLSHFFKDNFGMSFQNYLSRVRCENARKMLLLSNLNLTDICLACGFSDSKYFNQAFNALYGCTPKQYRQQFFHDSPPKQQGSLLSTQEFLSPQSALIHLRKGSGLPHQL